MKPLLTLIVAFVLVMACAPATIHAQQTLFQGFEGTVNDNFSFTVAPAKYNVPVETDTWSDTTTTSAIPPATGARFWFMSDLDNPSGGGNFFHTMDFQTVAIGGFASNTLSFKYFTVGYEGVDSIGYILETDNGSTFNFSKYVDLNRNTLAWVTITVNIPQGAQFVRLRLMAKQNANTDFAGFDDIQLFSSNTDLTPPVITGFTTPNATSVQVAFSEPIGISAENTANYTGVAGLVSATRNATNDTVTLSYGAPFTNGVLNTLTVSNIADLAGNALAAPVNYTFTWNSSTPALVITEINYNPPSNDPDVLEFIEIYNNGLAPAPIGGLRVGGVVQMELPAITLQPGGVVLIGQNKAAAEAFFTGQTFYQWTNGVLTNGGNTIVIRNSVGVTIDTVQYDDAAPWPTTPDGSGPSLELISPNFDNNNGSNWIASSTPTSDVVIFASPGVVNIPQVGIVSFEKSNLITFESAGVVTVNVKADNVGASTVSVKIRAGSGSTAVDGVDYLLVDSVVTFSAGSPNPQAIAVAIINDNDERNSNYLMLELTDLVNADPGVITRMAIMINDDDTPIPAAQPGNKVQLQHLGSFFIEQGSDATAEISAYDPGSKRLFVTNINQNRLEILNLSNPFAITKLTPIDLSVYGGGINSVAVNAGRVAVAIQPPVPTDPGKVVFFDANGVLVNQLTVGVLPDHVVFTTDGRKVLTANEGQPNDNYTIDPLGTVSIIDISGGVATATQANVKTLDFTAFNPLQALYELNGFRVFGPNATLAQDVEPEFIAISADDKTAYVTLQENNGVAIIDLVKDSIAGIAPLGLKDWKANQQAFDASDNNGGIFFNNWPVHSLYLPDAIATYSVAGGRYLVTANEGDAREYDTYEELVRVGASTYLLDPTVFPDATTLKRSDLLGRLQATTASGDTDGDGDFDQIHLIGTRSFSIWDGNTGDLVWDSGDDFERITAADPEFASLFNASNSNNTFKNRSDDKGPEPEGVTVAEIDGRFYAFVVLERVGGVMLYDVTDPAQPEFIQWINTRITGPDEGGDLGPEGVVFIPKAESPNGRNMLVVSNEISGSVALFQLDINRLNDGEFALTKYAFDSLPVIGQYNGLNIREGGISGMYYRDGNFHFVSDRGPNAAAINNPLAGGKVTLVFPFPDYAPKKYTVTPNGADLDVLEVTELKRPGGQGMTGVPLPVGFGNTGEVAWSDNNGTVTPYDIWGIDSEGLFQDKFGNWWFCDEYGSSIYKMNANYEVVERYTPFPSEPEDKQLDAVFGKRRANRGFEGIAYTPNGKVYAMIQSPMDNPTTAIGNTSRIHRLVELDPFTGTTRTFAYLHEAELGQIRSRDWKIGDMVAVNNLEFLLIEHAERNGFNSKNIYKISIDGATPITTDDFGGKKLEELLDGNGLAANGIVPVAKSFYADLLELGWELQHDKPEGLAIVDDNTIAVVNDNDYGINAPAEDGNIELTGKTTRLYVFDVPSNLAVNYVTPYCSASAGDAPLVCDPPVTENLAGNEIPAGGTWFVNAPNASVTPDGQFTANAIGLYDVLYSVVVTPSGCIGYDSMTINVTICPATTEPAFEGALVFPNPTEGQVILRLPAFSGEKMVYTVRNTAGQLVRGAESVTNLDTPVDLTNLPRGLYLLELQSGQAVAMFRITVQ
jgi:hypothetical protein